MVPCKPGSRDCVWDERPRGTVPCGQRLHHGGQPRVVRRGVKIGRTGQPWFHLPTFSLGDGQCGSSWVSNRHGHRIDTAGFHMSQQRVQANKPFVRQPASRPSPQSKRARLSLNPPHGCAAEPARHCHWWRDWPKPVAEQHRLGASGTFAPCRAVSV